MTAAPRPVQQRLFDPPPPKACYVGRLCAPAATRHALTVTVNSRWL